MKLRPTVGEDVAGWVFFCPGCDHTHIFYVRGPVTWGFNGNEEKPSFWPSLLNTCDNHPDPKQRRCHLVLTDGRISYGDDCSHDLKGQTVDLPDFRY